MRATRVEFSKRGVELGRADVRITHGVLQIRGTISAIRGANIKNLEVEVETIARVLRQKPDIKNVIIECTYSDA